MLNLGKVKVSSRVRKVVRIGPHSVSVTAAVPQGLENRKKNNPSLIIIYSFKIRGGFSGR